MSLVYLSFLSMLQDVLNKTVGALLESFLKALFEIMIKIVGQLIMSVLYGFLLEIMQLLLKTVYYISKAFDVLSGVADISVMNGTAVAQQTTLLNYIMQGSSMSRILAGMTLIGALLAFIFSIYATGKSISDSVMDDEFKPISHVLKDGMKSALMFMLIPFLCIMCLQFSGGVLKATETSFRLANTEYGNDSVDSALFKICAESALRVPKTDNPNDPYNVFWRDSQAYLKNHDDIDDIYDIKRIDYFLGIVSTLTLLIILAGACLSFVRRIVDLVVLYAVSPFFAATIALDGGAKFRKWRDSFVGNFFGCFGSIFAMRIFIMLIPLITSGTVTFSPNVRVNYVAKLVFIIGGSWSVYKGQHLIMELLNPAGANNAAESTALIGGLAMKLGKKAMGQ